MKKHKIAVMIDWYLPGTKAGGPVRSVYSLVNVLKDYYDFYIITTNLDLGSSTPYKSITSDTILEKEGVHYYYFSHAKLSATTITDLFQLIKPDLIYLNSFWSYSFSITVVQLKKKNLIVPPVLLAPRGMLGKGALSLKAFKKKLYLTLAKISGLYKNIIFHATQQQELQDINNKFPANKIIVAPNINSGSVVKNVMNKEIGSLKLFYLSRISRVKNLHFALSCLKSVSKTVFIQYDIYGNMEDKEYWNECLAIISTFPNNITVTYKGELQFDQVQKTICQYNCLFLPTLNENFGHSIVESLLCGCPVIISDQTPWTDVKEKQAGFSLPLNDYNKFAEAIEFYAQLDAQALKQLSEQATEYITEKIDSPSIIKKYKNLFDASIQN